MNKEQFEWILCPNCKNKTGLSFFLWGDDPVHTHYILKVA